MADGNDETHNSLVKITRLLSKSRT